MNDTEIDELEAFLKELNFIEFVDDEIRITEQGLRVVGPLFLLLSATDVIKLVIMWRQLEAHDRASRAAQ